MFTEPSTGKVVQVWLEPMEKAGYNYIENIEFVQVSWLIWTFFSHLVPNFYQTGDRLLQQVIIW